MSGLREGYKMTELGEIPKEWDILRLDELSLKITDGSHSSPTEIEESNYKICSVKHMKKDHFDFHNALSISEEDFFRLKKNGCNPIDGDVLLSKDGTIGKTFVFNQSNLNIVLLSSIAIIRCNKEKILPDFLKYFIENPNTILKLIGMKSGSAIKRIVLRDISNLLVILPDLQEQKKIASILSTVDEQIYETEQLIVKAKELKKGLMQQLLTKGIGHTEFKQTEFGEIPKEWDILRLDGLSLKITDGSHFSPIEIEESNYKICSVKHMKKDHFDYVNALSITEEDFLRLKNNGCNPIDGDVLLSKDGTIGKTLVFNQSNLNIVLLSSIAIIRCNQEKILPIFLKYFIENPRTISKLIGMKSGSAIKRIVLRDISNLLVILPDLKEQQKIASILSSVDEQIEAYEQEKVKYEELKKGLMQKLLTGQIRVKC